MKTIKHSCENCESQFTIVYDPDKVTDDPHFCPICAEYLTEDIEDADDLDL